jgi:two-component system, cell cycle response regulator DivK
MAKKVLVAVPDLLLQSRITEGAKRAGVELVHAGTPDDVLLAGKREKPGLIILDLESPRMQAEATLHRIRADADLCATPTLGFCGHANQGLMKRAQTAGCDRVMARGQFVDQVEALLKPYA